MCLHYLLFSVSSVTGGHGNIKSGKAYSILNLSRAVGNSGVFSMWEFCFYYGIGMLFE